MEILLTWASSASLVACLSRLRLSFSLVLFISFCILAVLIRVFVFEGRVLSVFLNLLGALQTPTQLTFGSRPSQGPQVTFLPSTNFEWPGSCLF